MDDIPELVTTLDEAKSKNVISNVIDKTQFDNKIQDNEEQIRKIPITIITGYLGSGKSTLLDKIGKTSNKKIAIIMNEFGDSSLIEKSVTIQDSERKEAVQEWLDLGNGCLCCTVKDNGVSAIEDLIERSKNSIDYILLETTGIADPAPIAKMFWLDEALASYVYIDGVVTVVDSEHIITCLDDKGGHWHRTNNHLKLSQAVNKEDVTEEEIEDEQKKLQEGITTAHLQIALADTILLNKIDKLNGSEDKILKITSRLRAINGSSPIHPTSFGDIDLDKILDLHSFEANGKLISSLNYITSQVYHDDRIATVSIDFPFFTLVEQIGQVESFLQYVLWEEKINNKNVEIHRVKGILVKQGDPLVVKVIQGVRDTYDFIDGQLVDGLKTNKLIFIGKNLNYDDILTEFKNYVN